MMELWESPVRAMAEQPLLWLALVLLGAALIWSLWRRRRIAAELARLQDQLAFGDHLAADLMGKMAHELRTPLNSVLGFSRLIARDETLPSAHRQQLNIINRNGEHLLALISDILDFSRIEAGHATLHDQVFNLGQFLDDLSLLVIEEAHSRRQRFNPMIHPDARKLTVRTDKDKLRQVLLNLLYNAVKYAKASHVTLGVRVRTPGEDRAVLQFDVEDSGPGIPPEKLEAIFRPFERIAAASGAEGGTGLGLAITKSLVELMQGKITASITRTGGTRFAVVLPLPMAHVPEAETDADSGRIPYRLSAGQPEVRVLIVDDDADSRKLLSAFLTGFGFVTREAVNGTEALASFDDWQPQFVWLDLQLPDINGREVQQLIRGKPTGALTRIAALTAFASRDQRDQIVLGGFDDLVLKPFRDEEILASMSRLLPLAFDTREKAAPPKVFVGLQPDDLGDFSPEMLVQMKEAIRRSHNRRAHELIDQLPPDRDEVAHELRLLVDTCEWGQLEQLVDAVRQAQGFTNPN